MFSSVETASMYIRHKSNAILLLIEEAGLLVRDA